MVQHLRRSALFRQARHIALYLPVRGEADPRALRRQTHPQQYFCRISPVSQGRIVVCALGCFPRFRQNRFRIPEPYPHYRRQCNARHLDLVITPLVGFDATGTRMGMGGGFYDRTFAFKRRTRRALRPRLIGYAFDFQNVPQLTRQTWDVALDAVVTESGLRYFCKPCPTGTR